MDSPRVHNETDFIAEPRMIVGKTGERLVLVVKATFEWQPGDVLPEIAPVKRQRGIRDADLPWGEPQKSSIKYPADVCPVKPGTDVIVVAAAHAPRGKAVTSFDAGVRVGSLEKTIRVFGLRVWESKGMGLSAPRPTTSVDVRYDYAWGGIDTSNPEEIAEEPRNPVGLGIAVDPGTLTHKPAPQIEDPSNLITSIRTKPIPAGLGAIGRHWEPRRKLLGTYDENWLTQRAPLLPLDHDDRANLCASPGLTAVPPFQGEEQVALLNLTPNGGSVSFRLPPVKIRIKMETKGRAPEILQPYLDTVLLDTLAVPTPGDVTIEMVWRAAFTPPRRLKDAEITVSEVAK